MVNRSLAAIRPSPPAAIHVVQSSSSHYIGQLVSGSNSAAAAAPATITSANHYPAEFPRPPACNYSPVVLRLCWLFHRRCRKTITSTRRGNHHQQHDKRKKSACKKEWHRELVKKRLERCDLDIDHLQSSTDLNNCLIEKTKLEILYLRKNLFFNSVY